jgi:hypothetical protein
LNSAATAQGFQKQQGNCPEQKQVQPASEEVSGNYSCGPTGQQNYKESPNQFKPSQRSISIRCWWWVAGCVATGKSFFLIRLYRRGRGVGCRGAYGAAMDIQVSLGFFIALRRTPREKS